MLPCCYKFLHTLFFIPPKCCCLLYSGKTIICGTKSCMSEYFKAQHQNNTRQSNSHCIAQMKCCQLHIVLLLNLAHSKYSIAILNTLERNYLWINNTLKCGTSIFKYCATNVGTPRSTSPCIHPSTNNHEIRKQHQIQYSCINLFQSPQMIINHYCNI